MRGDDQRPSPFLVEDSHRAMRWHLSMVSQRSIKQRYRED